MKKIFNILMVVLVISLLFSCTKMDEFLDKKPLGEYSETAVWSDPALVQTFVNSMYRNALGWPFAIERLSDYSDETFFTPDWDVTNFNKSLMTSDDLLGWDVDWGYPEPTAHTNHFRWGPLYSNVRRTNIFFSKINDVPGEEAEDRCFERTSLLFTRMDLFLSDSSLWRRTDYYQGLHTRLMNSKFREIRMKSVLTMLSDS